MVDRMSPREHERQEILARIDALLEEAYALPRSTQSWEPRLRIDWELFQLFRRMADLSGNDDTPDALDHIAPTHQHPRRPRPHNHPTRLMRSQGKRGMLNR